MASNEENTEMQQLKVAEEVSPSPTSKPKRKRKPPAQPWRKPPGFPKRYLSAYNLFFKQERERLLKAGLGTDSSLPKGGLSEDKEDYTITKPTLPDPNAPKSNAVRKHARSSGIGFANLARIVAKKWKNLDPALKAPFEEVAQKDKERYQREMVIWRANEEKRKGAESTEDKKNSDQWGTEPFPRTAAASILRTPGTELEQQGTTFYSMSYPQHGRRAPNFASTTHKGSAVHIFGSPPNFGPIMRSRTPTTLGNKPAIGGSASANISSDRDLPEAGADVGYQRARSFESSAGNYRRPGGEAYEQPPPYMRWEGYNPYVQPSPYALHYAYPREGDQTTPYYPPEEYYALPSRQRSIPSPHPPFSSPQSIPHPHYERSLYPPPPGYPYGPPYYPPNTMQIIKSKYTSPAQHPHSNGKREIVTPYTGGDHPENSFAFHHKEETLQLKASREDFRVPQSKRSLRTESDKDKAVESSSSQAPPRASKHEECSLLESSFENLDSNLDTDTIDFLTTLELE